MLLALTGWLFAQGMLSAREQTLAWSVIFFFASAAASSAYLTVSETFPLEIRALAIALFYAVGTGIGGVIGPMLFGALIDTGSRTSLFGGYLLGAVLMMLRGRRDVALGRGGRAQAARSRSRGRSRSRTDLRMLSPVHRHAMLGLIAAFDHLRVNPAIGM